jgi:hypothetical protein
MDRCARFGPPNHVGPDGTRAYWCAAHNPEKRLEKARERRREARLALEHAEKDVCDAEYWHYEWKQIARI